MPVEELPGYCSGSSTRPRGPAASSFPRRCTRPLLRLALEYLSERQLEWKSTRSSISGATRDSIGTSDPDAVLARWLPMASLWLYPWVLELLLKRHPEAENVLKESERVLAHDPALDRFNTYLFLAYDVLVRFTDIKPA